MTQRLTVARREPLLPFTFIVRAQPIGTTAEGNWVPVAGCKSLSGLAMNVGTYEIWEGGNTLHRHAQPDKVTWDPITLEQGLACGDTLFQWAKSARQFATDGTAASGQPVKRNLVIEIWDYNADRIVFGPDAPLLRFRVFNAWVSKYRALPKVDAMTSEVAFESVEFVHDGWERFEPTELPAVPAPSTDNRGETDLAGRFSNIA